MNSTPETLSKAMAWFDAGCSVIPIRADGSKAPLVPTKLGLYQDDEQHRRVWAVPAYLQG
ncbi:hypothetical protein Acsp02_82850 [Actinoplanes sp. NBRC 103695]|nr:hypothetical protein Acsp02_82850 [Actinoplanes sp. NBRC 103695]